VGFRLAPSSFGVTPLSGVRARQNPTARLHQRGATRGKSALVAIPGRWDSTSSLVRGTLTKDLLSISSWECEMQQPQLTTYAEIAEVRTVTGAATCNQLLAEGWLLLGVYPLTTVAEMTPRETSEGGEQKKRQDIQRYVRRLVGYVVGRKREPEV
jgi:hypothetical protein